MFDGSEKLEIAAHLCVGSKAYWDTAPLSGMQYDAKTPTEYLKLLEPDWRKDKLVEIRKLVKKHGPELKE